MRKKGFTLIEMIIAMTGFFILMTFVFQVYMGIIKFRYVFQARSNLIENTYYMVEKISFLLKDYTIDYDEYFNRRFVGCDSGYQDKFDWAVGINGYCDNFTDYGNSNYLGGTHKFYYCSSKVGYQNEDETVFQVSYDNRSGCAQQGKQSYGQYQKQFIDVKSDVDSESSVVGDNDDSDYGIGPDAVYMATGVKEIYLISQDKKSRVYIRRALLDSGDWNNDGVISGDNEYRYTLQILKMKAFDAGQDHSFLSDTTTGVYDGVTDTWACDYAQGFICNGTGIGNLYSGFRLPSDQNDGRVNLFDKNLTVADWNVSVYPTGNPDYFWASDSMQINPYFTISIKTKLYLGVWHSRLPQSANDFQFGLQTTFNTKNNYGN